MTDAAGLLNTTPPSEATADPKKQKALKHMSSCEKWVSGISVAFWIAFGLFGWMQIAHALANLGPWYEYGFMLYLTQGGTFLYLSVLGFWMSFREAFMEVDHYLATVSLEVIQFIMFVTAAFMVLVGPWSLGKEGEGMNSMNMMTLSQLVALTGVVMALIHLIVGLMRPSWRRQEAEAAEALKRAKANAT